MSDESQKQPVTDNRLDDEDFSASGNAMAIAGFVLAFLFPPLGFIFSIIGFNKSDEVGGQGRGLSIAGIAISSLFIAWFFGVLLLGGLVSNNLSSSFEREGLGSLAWVRRQFNADEIPEAVLVVSGDTSKIKTVSGQFRYQPSQPATCRYLVDDYRIRRSTARDDQVWIGYSDYLVIEPNGEQIDFTTTETDDGYLPGPDFLAGGRYVLAENCGNWQLVDDLLPVGA